MELALKQKNMARGIATDPAVREVQNAHLSFGCPALYKATIVPQSLPMVCIVHLLAVWSSNTAIFALGCPTLHIELGSERREELGSLKCFIYDVVTSFSSVPFS